MLCRERQYENDATKHPSVLFQRCGVWLSLILFGHVGNKPRKPRGFPVQRCVTATRQVLENGAISHISMIVGQHQAKQADGYVGGKTKWNTNGLVPTSPRFAHQTRPSRKPVWNPSNFQAPTYLLSNMYEHDLAGHSMPQVSWLARVVAAQRHTGTSRA